jgi:hypothetical protein
VSAVPPGPALLAGLVLFFGPGLVALALLAPRDRDALAWDERLFLAVATSVGASAWLALALAEAGAFSLLRAGALLAAGGVAALFFGRRRARWPLSRPPSLGQALPALAVLVIAFVFQARPTEYLLGGRDPGTYVAGMALVARTGGIAYTDPVVQAIPAEDVELFFRNPGRGDWGWGRFMGMPLERPDSARVVPEFFHLFPAFGAYLFQSMGVKGALATPPLFGILGTLAVYFALRRILGPAPALLAAVLLAVNVVQVWFARYPVAEGAAQLLIFLALLAVALWEQYGSAVFAALAGTALGLSLLMRIDSVLLVLPVGLYLLVRWAHRDLPVRQALALLVPLALLAFHAFAHAALFARKYLLEIANRPYWSAPPLTWVLLAALAAALVLVVHAYGPALLGRLEGRGDALRGAVMGVLAVLALYAYFLRPVLSAAAGGDGNDAVSAAMTPWLPDGPTSLQPLLARLGFRRLAAHDAQAMLRLGWFVTPLGLWLGVIGLLLAIARWRERYLLPVLVTLTFAGFYFYKVRIYNDYFFAWRRFVPVVLPLTLGFAALALVALAAPRGARRVLAGTMAALLAVLFLRQTLPVARHVDWRGSVRFVADVARRFGPRDVVIFEQKESIHLLSLPLWAVHGVNVLELARFNPDPARMNHLIRAWRGRYQNTYFAYTYRTDLCGVFLQRVEDHVFGTTEWERGYGRPPRGPEPRGFRFTVARAVLPEELQVPPLREVDVGGSDEFQVSGFYDKEGGYRWTGRCASVYLPGARGGRAVEVTASLGERRPASLAPAVVRVSLSGQPLGEFTPGPRWTRAAFALPHPLPAEPPVLRLDVVSPVTGRPFTWRPAELLAGSDDPRDLGVMVDAVRVLD